MPEDNDISSTRAHVRGEAQPGSKTGNYHSGIEAKLSVIFRVL